MKITGVFLLFLFPLYLNGQTFWSIVVDREDFNKSSLTDKALFQDSIILISGVSCNAHKLFAYNQKGEMLWNADGYHDLIYTDRNHFYTAGSTIPGCILDNEQLFLTKYDKNGTEIFSIGYPEVPHYENFAFFPKNIHTGHNGDIIVSSCNSVVVFNSTGSAAKEYHIATANEIKSVFSITADAYLISTRGKLYLADNTFVPDDSLSLEGDLVKTIFANDTVYALLQSELIRLDTKLNIIDTLVTSISGDFHDMDFYGDCLWVQAGDMETIKLLKIKNAGVPDTLSFDRLSEIKGFIVAGNNYSFIGNSFSEQISIYNYSNPARNNPKPSLPDIELVDFIIFDVEKEYQYDHMGGAHLIGHRFSTEITVKNNGEETINSFSFYSELGGIFGCVDGVFYRKFEDAEILSGQSLVLTIMDLFNTAKSTICFECLAPNSMLETQVINNTICKEFPYTGIPRQDQPDMKVFPNPVSDWLIVDFDCSESKRIELYDMTGRRVYLKEGFFQQAGIDMSGFKPGIYILNILTNKRQDSRKIIKE